MDLLAHLFRRDRAGKWVEPPVELSPLEAGQLSSVFTPPRWLSDLGRTAWLLVGLFLLVVGVVWFLGATRTIAGPVVVGTIIATVTMPVVASMARRMPRALAAALVLLAIVAVAVLIAVLVIAGITSQLDSIFHYGAAAAD